MLEAIDEIQAEEEDWWDDLSEEQQARLERAIEESKDPKNWISHKKVKKKMKKWLSKKKSN